MFGVKLDKREYSHSLEVVDSCSEAQIQVGVKFTLKKKVCTSYMLQQAVNLNLFFLEQLWLYIKKSGTSRYLRKIVILSIFQYTHAKISLIIV